MIRLLRGSLALNPFVQICAAGLTFLLGLYHIRLLTLATQALSGNDFGKFYYAVHMWQHGQSLYAPTSATHMLVGSEWVEFLDMNPPHFHLLVWPFVHLPLWEAGYYWWLLNLACTVFAIGVVLRELRCALRPRLIFPAAICILGSAPAGATTVTGQYPGLLLLLVAFAWRDLRHQREFSSGAWLGTLISLKPFLAVFLPGLLARRQWRTACSALVSTAVWFAIGFGLFGAASYREWVSALHSVDWEAASMNASLPGFLSRALAPSRFDPVIIARWAIAPLSVAGAILVAVLSIRCARRSIDHLFAVSALAALLISPLGWIYYVWLAVPGTMALWHQHRLPALFWPGVLILLLPFNTPARIFSTGSLATATSISAYFWAVLLIWAAAIAVGAAEGINRNGHETEALSGAYDRIWR